MNDRSERTVDVNNIVWRWGAIVAVAGVIFLAGQYVGRSASIAGNTYRIELLEKRVGTVEATANMVPLLVERLDSIARWQRDIESVRESRGAQQSAMQASISGMTNDLVFVKRSLERIEERMESLERGQTR